MGDNVLEGNRIILRKAKLDDYESMLKNVYSDEEVYKWMLFKPTFTLEDAKERIDRTIKFQKDHYAYFICLKDTDEAIGLCAIDEYEEHRFKECGICIGVKYQNKGIGKEVVSLLLDLAFNKLNALDFEYAYFQNNIRSKKIAEHFNFKYDRTEELTRPWDNKKKTIDYCILKKEDYYKNID